MANSLSASFPKYWSRRMQRQHYKQDVYRDFVTMEEKATLKRGTIVDRPYRSALTVNTMGSDGSYSRQDITDTSETLTINQEKEVSFYIREVDEIQSNYKTANEYADDAAVKLGNQISGQVFGEYSNAVDTIDDGDLGGTAGNGLTLSTGNVLEVIALAAEKLDLQEVGQDNRRAAISPQFKRMLKLALQGRDTPIGDTVGMRGQIGNWDGFGFNLSTALGWSGVLQMATNPSNGDTVTINGVTWTFKTSPATAGEIDIGGSAAATVALLVAAINGTGTQDTATTYYEVSAANRALLKNITATDNTTNVSIKALGYGRIVVSETLTAAADIWTLAKQIQHNFFARKGCIDLVIQKEPNMQIKDRSGYIGRDIVSWAVFGLKTFTEGTKELIDVQIRTDAF